MATEGDIAPCELGTKEYWDKAYELEIKNFKSHGDVGEEWFGEDSAHRIVRWLSNNENVKKEARIVDLGCGNGMLLISLAEEGFTDLLGVDYSQQAVKLARAIASKMQLNVKYQVWDILGEEASPASVVDIALDKGTYDAIGLSEGGVQARTTYVKRVCDILSPGGLLVLTSCNFTRAELEEDFSGSFSVLSHIPAPTFKFGGQEGSLVTALVMKRKST